MVRSVAGDLPEQVKNNQYVNLAAGNGGQKMSQYSWFTVYEETDYTPVVPTPKRSGRKKKLPDPPPPSSEKMDRPELASHSSQEPAFDDLLPEEDVCLTPVDKDSIMS